MIPPELDSFFAGPRFAAMAWMGPDGRPSLTRAAGYSRDGNRLRFLVLRHLLSTPPRAGQVVAVVMSEAERFVAFQVKGVATIGPSSQADLEAGRAMMAELGAMVERTMGLPASLYTSIPIHEQTALTVEVEVSQVFRQSPGAGAGDRVESP